jgi:hypothetical protein
MAKFTHDHEHEYENVDNLIWNICRYRHGHGHSTAQTRTNGSTDNGFLNGQRKLCLALSMPLVARNEDFGGGASGVVEVS